MKAVRLIGRIGNQMFIYAFAKALEFYTKEKVYFDISNYKNHTRDTLELENLFNIKLDIVPEKELKRLTKINFENVKFLNKFRKRLRFILRYYYIKEKATNVYQKDLVKHKGSGYYCGYFQTEKYFKEIETKIRDDFSFKPVYDEKLISLRKEIENYKCPIFINVRRGDFVKLDKEGIAHWLCDMSYYQKAAKIMAEKYPDYTFVAVSDEPEWLKENFKIDFPFKIYSSGTAIHDIYLLQACKHAICANSSYSWWAAWLIDNPDKTVIAPEPWFEEGRETDIVPDEWIKVPRYEK